MLISRSNIERSYQKCVFEKYMEGGGDGCWSSEIPTGVETVCSKDAGPSFAAESI